MRQMNTRFWKLHKFLNFLIQQMHGSTVIFLPYDEILIYYSKISQKGLRERTNAWHLYKDTSFFPSIALIDIIFLSDILVRLKQWKGWQISRFLQVLNLGMCLSWRGKVHRSWIGHQYVVITCSRLKLASQNASGAQVLNCIWWTNYTCQSPYLLVSLCLNIFLRVCQPCLGTNFLDNYRYIFPWIFPTIVLFKGTYIYLVVVSRHGHYLVKPEKNDWTEFFGFGFNILTFQLLSLDLRPNSSSKTSSWRWGLPNTKYGDHPCLLIRCGLFNIL